MKRLWQKEYYLRASDFDKFNHIKPSAILDLFQDAAGHTPKKSVLDSKK